MVKFKKPLLFALSLVPIAVVSGIFTGLYQLDLYPKESISQAIAQVGSTKVLVAVGAAQTAGYALFCGFFGYILADKTGLWKPLRPEKTRLLRTLLLSLIFGVLFSLDYWTFGAAFPDIQESTLAGLTGNGVIASILYGGIIEEVMLRLFFLSLIAFLLWKLFYRKTDREHIPGGVFAAANVIAALLFAAGHLPATIMTFGELTPLILFRCFLFNGGFGLAFGWLYRKYGLSYAMISHAVVHVVSKVIWGMFI